MMKIDKNTTGKLLVKSDNRLIWILVFGFIIGYFWFFISIWIDVESPSIIGISIFLLLTRFMLVKVSSPLRLPTIISTFNNFEGIFLLEKEWLWKNEVTEFPISKIANVHVVQKGKPRKGRIYFRVEVEIFPERFVALSSQNYRPKQGVKNVANEIRAFLDIPEDVSRIHRPGKLIV